MKSVFPGTCASEKHLDPRPVARNRGYRGAAAPSAHTGAAPRIQGVSDTPWNYTSFAALIFTPGPMVEAVTQLFIYWPFAAAGLALMMAPMRAL